MRAPKPEKSAFRRMMDAEEELSRAAKCPPGHTYNPNIKKCLPGSPLSGAAGALGAGNVGGGGNSGKTSGKNGKSGPSADAMLAGEAYDRAVKAKSL